MKRKVISKREEFTEHVNIGRKTWTWQRKRTLVLGLECGHERRLRGYSATGPKKGITVCHECKAAEVAKVTP